MTTPERLGKYEIVEVLGKGAMGVVYRAFDPDIHRTVAIKTIRKELVDDQERAAMMFARFKNEARAAGRLSHPGIVAVHDYGDTGAVTYIAMEFVQGMSLRDYFNRGTRFQERDIVSIMAQLLEALQHAHEQGVWHRDIKPANLIVMNNGRVKIADFGIAKVETSQLTQTGLVMGSPGYMAPEQYTGGGVDWRADLFAAGVVMYQLLTGVRAFAGTTEQMAYKICHTSPPPVSESDPGQGWERYDAVMTRALAKEPDARFQTAESFRAAILEAYAAPVSPTVSEATIIAEATRPVVVFEPSNPSARTFPDQTPPPLARPIPPPAPAAQAAAANLAEAAGAAAGSRRRAALIGGAVAAAVALPQGWCSPSAAGARAVGRATARRNPSRRGPRRSRRRPRRRASRRLRPGRQGRESRAAPRAEGGRGRRRAQSARPGIAAGEGRRRRARGGRAAEEQARGAGAQARSGPRGGTADRVLARPGHHRQGRGQAAVQPPALAHRHPGRDPRGRRDPARERALAGADRRGGAPHARGVRRARGAQRAEDRPARLHERARGGRLTARPACGRLHPDPIPVNRRRGEARCTSSKPPSGARSTSSGRSRTASPRWP
ncbi:MAG: serine/threonine-protein kinase [Burkholderiales bacterium]